MHTATIAVYPTAEGPIEFRVRRERITAARPKGETGPKRPGHPAWRKRDRGLECGRLRRQDA